MHSSAPNPFHLVRGIVRKKSNTEIMQNSSRPLIVERTVCFNTAAARPSSVFFSGLLFGINNFTILQNQAP
jgi:hypothetical protein